MHLSTALLTPSYTASSCEMTTTTTTAATTITLPTTIESTGAVPRAPRGQTTAAAAHACRRLDAIMFAKRSGDFRKRANAHAFECPQCAACTIVFGQGLMRDDSADDVVIVFGNGNARGNVHYGCRGISDGNGDTDNSAKLNNYYIYYYFIIATARRS